LSMAAAPERASRVQQVEGDQLHRLF